MGTLDPLDPLGSPVIRLQSPETAVTVSHRAIACHSVSSDHTCRLIKTQPGRVKIGPKNKTRFPLPHQPLNKDTILPISLMASRFEFQLEFVSLI